jgi:branched-chain amino acid transport system permease protein
VTDGSPKEAAEARLAIVRPGQAAGFAIAVAALAFAPWALDLSPYTQNLVTLAYLMIAGALAWNWMGGYVGQVSFGHAAMFGVGGFVTGRLLVLDAPVPAPLAWIAGALAAGIFALGGHPMLRLRGPYFSIATIGLGEATRLLLTYWEDFTGGASGLSLPIDPDMKLRLYWWGLGLVALAVAASHAIRRSTLGLQLLAIKADVDAAADVGVNATF